MRPLRTGAILVAASLGLACGGGAASSGPTSRGTVDHVDMSQPTATINVGQTVTLKAIGRAADGTEVAAGVQWSSAAASIASVTQFGVVTGVAPGIADIMATIGGKTGHTAVTVVAQSASGDYTDITLAPTTWTTCGRTDVGKVRCWGMNPVGQIGDGTTTDRSTATLVSTTQSFAQVAISDSQSCGRTVAGDLYCWGSLGFSPGSTQRSLTPVAFSTGLSFADVALGYEDACARTVAGQAFCWGRNLYGAAGDGS
jgi:hypothetical protein